MRRLVFDNYQYCLLSFKAEFLINTPQVTDCISELGKEHRRAVNNINQIQTKFKPNNNLKNASGMKPLAGIQKHNNRVCKCQSKC